MERKANKEILDLNDFKKENKERIKKSKGGKMCSIRKRRR